MCGITALIDFNKDSSMSILQDMTDTLHHRGPDGSGYEFFDTSLVQVGLGHRRLAIIDLSELGKQPMNVSHLWITYNGEIYNFREIRQELERLGHHFRSDSDTEVILQAYLRWGYECVKKFIGMFAFVIYDTHNQRIFAARDRTGVKPMFYYSNDNLLLIASELKSFHKHPRFDKKINRNGVAAFMQYGNIPGSVSIFENVSKLKPGHYLTIDLTNSQLNINTIPYWNVYDYYNRPKISLSFQEAKEETERIIQSACNYRMIADVPVGVFLSSGYDSTTVAALLQKDRTEQIKTYTIGVPDAGLNEAPYAEDIAKHIGTNHTTYYCTEKEALEFIPELPYYYDEPFADSSAIPTHLISKIARKEVKVILSADGGDESFAGYNRYEYLQKYGSKIQQIPSYVRKAIASIMGAVPSQKIPILRDKYLFHNRYEKLKSVLRNPSSHYLMMSLYQQFIEEELQKLLIKDGIVPPNDYNSKELLRAYETPLSYMMAVDYQTYLPDDILQKVDRATMSVSLEGREPLLDHRIIEWASQLPDQYKYFNGTKKRILREITHQYIPQELLNRPKMGFAIPIGKWLQTDLRPLLEAYINEEKIVSQGIYNWKVINQLKTDFLNGRLELETKMWYILNFQLWYEKWCK